MTFETLIHIRHGETDWNLARRLQGSRDIPLNDTGRAQAARNGRALKQLLIDLGRSADEMDWVCSPMGRTRETMEIVRREAGLDPAGYRIEEGLREISFGELEGLTYEEMEIQSPADFLRLRQDKWTFQPPGGESYVTLTARVEAALATLSGPGVVVAHGGVFRAVLSLIRGYHDQELAEMFVPQDRFFLSRGTQERWV
jgi:probable phosphoglycerate mutase